MMLAQEVIEKGESVILDATFGGGHQRDEVIRLAKDMDACMRQILSHDYILLTQQTGRALNNLSS